MNKTPPPSPLPASDEGELKLVKRGIEIKDGVVYEWASFRNKDGFFIGGIIREYCESGKEDADA